MFASLASRMSGRAGWGKRLVAASIVGGVVVGAVAASLLDHPAQSAGPKVQCADVLRATGEGRFAGMTWIAGGRFRMGSVGHDPDEAPVRSVDVQGFWIDTFEVTNAQFAAFVAATGWVTVAERSSSAGSSGVAPGGAVFTLPRRGNAGQWVFMAGANWRHPDGPASTIEGKESEPVVQIALEDAVAYAAWAGKKLPSEIQWEYAARGGLDAKTYAWGDELVTAEDWKANTWQGAFPYENSAADGFAGRSPVGCFAPNGYGVHDMIGNVWEWTRDPYSAGPAVAAAAGAPRGVIKGGSFLCAPNYCQRYRPAARHPQDADLGANHLGFRTVINID